MVPNEFAKLKCTVPIMFIRWPVKLYLFNISFKTFYLTGSSSARAKLLWILIVIIGDLRKVNVRRGSFPLKAMATRKTIHHRVASRSGNRTPHIGLSGRYCAGLGGAGGD